MKLTAALSLGTRVQFDGEQWTVEGFIGSCVHCRNHHGRSAIHDVAFLTSSEGFRVLDGEAARTPNALVTFPDNIPEDSLRQAEILLEHLNEAECGYKSGNHETALPGEPRSAYDGNGTTLNQRMEAKSQETGISVRTL